MYTLYFFSSPLLRAFAMQTIGGVTLEVKTCLLKATSGPSFFFSMGGLQEERMCIFLRDTTEHA